jgi:hypothetical protein
VVASGSEDEDVKQPDDAYWYNTSGLLMLVVTYGTFCVVGFRIYRAVNRAA